MRLNIKFKQNYFLYASLLIGFLSILSNKFDSFIQFIWEQFSKILSYVIPNIILTIIYFLILTPISFLQKTFDKKNTRLLLSSSLKSTFRIKNKTFDKDSFKKLW